ASPPGALLAPCRPCPRRRARRRCCRRRAGDGHGRGAALGCRGDSRQGARRAARSARDAGRPAVGVLVRRQPAARPGVRGEPAAAGSRRRPGRPRALSGPADGGRPRPQLRRGRRARAPVAGGDLRDGRHRGACARPARRRRRRRRSAGGARTRRRRNPAGAPGPAGRPGRARRRPARLARGRRPAPAAAPGGARASGIASALVDDRSGRGRRPRGGSGLTAEPIRVSPGWLDLRERADAAARARALVGDLRRLPRGRPWVIHDLACGSGSMGRWLAPLLPGPQRWILHDRDADLLALAAAGTPGRAADGAAVAVETRLSDVTQLDRGDLAGATLITASALLDLLTADELAAVVDGCAGAACPVLVTLSVTGRVRLDPP